jgi:hypothetical protein
VAQTPRSKYGVSCAKYIKAQEIRMALREVDFLRYLTDYIDQKIAASKAEVSDSSSVEQPEEDPSQEGENPMDRDDVFVPPLQAKIEMMKKLSGIPLKNETLKQSQEQGGPQGGESSEGQAEQLKKQLTMSEMFDDGPVDE